MGFCRRVLKPALFDRRRLGLMVLCVVFYFTFKLITIASDIDNTPEQPDEVALKHRDSVVKSAVTLSPACDPQIALGLPKSMTNSNCEECKQFQCHKYLYPQNKSIFDKTRKWMNSNLRIQEPDSSIASRAKGNCSKFLEDERFNLKPLSVEEEDFPLAYNILMHKDVAQFLQLLRTIYHPQNVYCVHIDAKSSKAVNDGVRAVLSCLKNVFLSTKSETIIYAGYSRLQADINCMYDHDTAHSSRVQWKYLINTAASGLPLKTNLEMVQTLKIYNGANDIEGMYGARVHKSRFQTEWLESTNGTGKMYKTKQKNPPPPHDISIVRGSAYGIFSRDFVHFIVADQRAIDLLFWSRKTYSPDEHYWSTLHHTGPNPHLKTPGGYKGMEIISVILTLSVNRWFPTFGTSFYLMQAWVGTILCFSIKHWALSLRMSKRRGQL